MSDNDFGTQAYGQPHELNPDFRNLDRVGGTWGMSRGVQGTGTFEWTESDCFLF